MPNTDRSAFSQRNESDAVKLIRLLENAGASYDFSVFDVTRDQFPADPTSFDAIIITGSPAFVDDPDDWIRKMMDDIHTVIAAKIPLVGLCFGHQAILAALGGEVAQQDYWIFGGTEFAINQTRRWMNPPKEQMKLYAANIAQATTLPNGFDLLGSSDLCPIAVTAYADQIFTTQFHPEMDDAFIHDLIEEYAADIGDGLSASRASIKEPADGPVFAQWIRGFVEMARNPA